MKLLASSILPLLVLTAFQTSFAQDKPAEVPTVLETITGKPRIKILKVEDEPKRHYEKWRESMLIVSGNVLPTPEERTYVTRELKFSTFTVLLQANEKKADFAKRWDELRRELNKVDSGTPHLEKWDLSQWTGEGSGAFPVQTLRTSPTMGDVYCGWLIRTIEMEGVRVGKKTMFKATVSTQPSGPYGTSLEFGRTFNNETGQIVEPPGKRG